MITFVPMHPLYAVISVTNIQVAWLPTILLSSVAWDSNFYQVLVSGEISELAVMGTVALDSLKVKLKLTTPKTP